MMQKVNDYDGVADLYDVYVPAIFDIPFFVSEAKKSRGEVLELMSGTGRVSIPLLQAGVRLTCVDISAESNAVLRQKLEKLGLTADVIQMDVCELSLEKQFDQIIVPFHSFAHIADPVEQRKALDRIYRHLSPGGNFICTLGNPAIRRQSVDGKLRMYREYPLEDGRGTLLLWLLEHFDSTDDQIVNTFEFFEEYDQRGILHCKRLIKLRFRLSDREEFEELAGSAGFKVDAFYGNYDCAEFRGDDSPFMIWKMSQTDNHPEGGQSIV